MSREQRNILVIDDAISIRKYIRIMLEEANYKVFEASNGEDGISVYKTAGNIDLVITDVYMPKKSGLEVVVELKKEYKDTKIIVLSDGGKDHFSNELGICEALGAIYFIKKDLIKDELLNSINKIFSGEVS